MKKYESPVLEQDLIELEDIIAASGEGKLNSDWAGDHNSDIIW